MPIFLFFGQTSDIDTMKINEISPQGIPELLPMPTNFQQIIQQQRRAKNFKQLALVQCNY